MSHAVYDWFHLAIGFFGVICLFLVFFALIALLFLRNKKQSKDIKVEVKCLNKIYNENKNKILQSILEQDEYKKIFKEESEKLKKDKKQNKEEKNSKNHESTPKKRVFVLDFQGDVSVSCMPIFREHISTVLEVCRPTDEIVLRLESPGGYVHAYGLAASQLARIREKQIPLTICVDKVAASGGYMMACLANKIIAAPFSILGSIGVVANVPNFNRVLQKNNVDYLEMTAGEYKRTLTMLGEITEKGKAKFQDQLEETHVLFKDHIKKYRDVVDIDAVSTGEYWLGVKALEFKLVDELKTSDDYLLCASKSCKVYQIYTPKKESMREKIIGSASLLFGKVYDKKMDVEKSYPLFM